MCSLVLEKSISADDADGGKTSIRYDSSDEKIPVPTFKILVDVAAKDDDTDNRYLDNGDINPDALNLKKLLRECGKLGDVGESSMLAYDKGEKIVKIRDDKGLARAVRYLHEEFDRDNILELLFVPASGMKGEL